MNRLLRVALAIQLAWGAAFVASSAFAIDGAVYFSLFDDAMISMRYARNLADGAGLVWNPGATPVEGYTNLLWTLWMAILHRVATGPTVSLLVMGTGLALLLANIVVIWTLARHVEPGRPAVAGLASMLLACCYGLGYWTLRGMETGLFVLMLNMGVLAVVWQARGKSSAGRVLGTALALLPLIRPDGIVPAAALGLYVALAHRRTGVARWIFPAIPIAIFVAHAVVRHAYYGDWLPNTYYLKMSGVPILARVERGLSALLLTGAWALWPAAAAMAIGRPLAPSRWPLTMVIGLGCLFSVYAGGDAWEWTGHINRYIVSILPLALVIAAAGIERLATMPPSERWARWLRVAVLAGLAMHILAAMLFFPEPELSVGRYVLFAAMAVLGAALVVLAQRSHDAPFRPAVAALGCGILVLTMSGAKVLEWIRYRDLHVIDDAYLAEMGVRLKSVMTADARIAVVAAGAVPYYAGGFAIDLLGKSDRHIARLPSHIPFVPGHSKWDYRYSVDTWRPDVIVHLWRPAPEDLAFLNARNYRANAAGVFVRVGSEAVDGPAVLDMTLQVERRRAAARRH